MKNEEESERSSMFVSVVPESSLLDTPETYRDRLDLFMPIPSLPQRFIKNRQLFRKI